MPNPARLLQVIEDALHNNTISSAQALTLLNEIGDRVPNNRQGNNTVQPAPSRAIYIGEDEAPTPNGYVRTNISIPQPSRHWETILTEVSEAAKKKPKPTTKFKVGAEVFLHQNANKCFIVDVKYKILHSSQYNQHYELTLVTKVGKEEKTLYIMSNDVTLVTNDKKPSWF